VSNMSKIHASDGLTKRSLRRLAHFSLYADRRRRRSILARAPCGVGGGEVLARFYRHNADGLYPVGARTVR
jgi:hypothetical protein